IDGAVAKAALIAHCVARPQPIVVCGAAGGRIDPLALRREDLASTKGDALLASVRARLRRSYDFPRSGRGAFGVTAIHSTELPLGLGGEAAALGEPGTALSCAGYGSIVTVTAAMGLAAAALAINLLCVSGNAAPGAIRA
ncbi:MAG: tRNA threonylcarbamoyladenosine dehydratase, partial [Burkholderiaceae bacterium]|nr:tRNA threonylcarbamoyladenosine dehydratase [Burkholderiaceae bacterium]